MPLGVNGSAIKKDIKTILSRTKYDIYKDIEEMAAVIGKRYIIRAKIISQRCLHIHNLYVILDSHSENA